MSTPATWFSRSANGAAAPTRLFWFPFAGGNAAGVMPWQALLGRHVELNVAELPGHGARLLEPPLRDLDELVAGLTTAVADRADRRFAFFGHSLGALVAFEVARCLRRRGQPGPVSLWVCAAEGPQTRLLRHRFHDLPEAELIEALRDYNGTPAELLDDPEIMRLLLPGLRADFALAECYAYRAEPPLDLQIHVLFGEQDPYVEPERTGGWARETSRPLRRYAYPGDHFFIHPHRDAIAGLLARGLVGFVAPDQPRPAP